MSLYDLSPDKITKLELSSFCEQMDQMYFLPAERSKQHHWSAEGKQASAAQRPITSSKIGGKQPQSQDRVSINGLVSAIDFMQMEGNSSSSSPRIDDQQLQPAHLAAVRSFQPPPLLGPQLQVMTGQGILDSTVDWCGQPTSRAQWLKTRVNVLCAPNQRSAPASAAPSSGRRSPKPQQPSAALQPPRATSARPASAASIGADYRDLTEAEVAADVAIRHLGGSSCARPDERRYWLAASRRPYPIRKSLPDKHSRRGHQSRLEFVSLFGPGPERLAPRASQLSQGSAAAFQPPPASPSSRPTTASTGPASHRTAGRPLIGRPRPPVLSAPSAAVGSSSNLSDLTIASPRPQMATPAVATTMSVETVGQEAKVAITTVGHRRQRSRHRLCAGPTTPFSQPVELELLGNRFRYNGNELGAPQAKAREHQLTEQPEGGDPVLAELEHIVSSSTARLVQNPQIIFNNGLGNSSRQEQQAYDAAIVGDDDATKHPNDYTSGSAFDQRAYKYPAGAEQAALVIQSSYRGYSTRRRLSRLEQLARAQGFESVKALRRYYGALVGGGSQRPDEQQMLNFLENKRRIELAFDTTIRKNGPATVADLTKVFNVCGHFPSRRAVELALADRQSRRSRQPEASPRMSSGSPAPDRLAAVEIFHRLLLSGEASQTLPSSPRRRSPQQPPMIAKARLDRLTADVGQQPSLTVRGLSKLS